MRSAHAERGRNPEVKTSSHARGNFLIYFKRRRRKGGQQWRLLRPFLSRRWCAVEGAGGLRRNRRRTLAVAARGGAGGDPCRRRAVNASLTFVLASAPTCEQVNSRARGGSGLSTCVISKRGRKVGAFRQMIALSTVASAVESRLK